MSFPPSFFQNPDFLRHRVAFWYALLDITTDAADDTEDTDTSYTEYREAYYETYSDY